MRNVAHSESEESFVANVDMLKQSQNLVENRHLREWFTKQWLAVAQVM